MRALLWLLGWVVAGSAAAVAPDWSVDIGADVLNPNPFPAYLLGHTDPGHGLFLSEGGGDQTVAVLALGTCILVASCALVVFAEWLRQVGAPGDKPQVGA